MQPIIYYFSAVAISFVAAMPAGMINMSVAEISMRRGRPAGIVMAAGAAFIEFFQIFLAIKFAFIIDGNEVFNKGLNIVALIVFLTLMVYYFFFAKPVQPGQGKAVPRYRTFFRGMAVSSLNVLIFPFWILVTTYITSNELLDINNTNIAIFALGGMSGAFLLFMLYAILGDIIITRSARFGRHVNNMIAGLFLLLSAYQVYQIILIFFK